MSAVTQFDVDRGGMFDIVNRNGERFGPFIAECVGVDGNGNPVVVADGEWYDYDMIRPPAAGSAR